MSGISPQARKSVLVVAALIVAALVAALALQMTHPSASGHSLSAKVTVGDEVRALLPLDEPTRLVVEAQDGVNTVVVGEDGGVHIEDADCKGGDCMRQGTISREGQLLVCLPHRLIVEIVQTGSAKEPSVYSGGEVGQDAGADVALDGLSR